MRIGKWLRVLLFLAVIALPLTVLASGAEVPDIMLTSGGDSLIGDMIASAWREQPQDTVPGCDVAGIDVDRDAGVVTVRYSAEEEAALDIRIRGDGDEGPLLWESPRTVLSPEAESVALPLDGDALPEFFEVEATLTGRDGKTAGYEVRDYTSDVVFTRNATAADFPEGYYVPIVDGVRQDLAAAADGAAAAADADDINGYIAYSPDLVLLDPDTPYTLENGVARFDTLPEQLAGMTEEELSEIGGIVIRGRQRVEDDVYLLNGGAVLEDGGLTMQANAPESAGQVYDRMNLASNIAIAPQTVRLDTDHVTGRVSETPDVSVGITFSGLRPMISFSVQFKGSFDLEVRPTFEGYADYDTPVRPEWLHQPKDHICNLRIPLPYTLSAELSTSIRVAANHTVSVAGEYGFGLKFTLGFGTARKDITDGVRFTSIVPNMEGIHGSRDAYVYFDNSIGVSLNGLDLRFDDFIGKIPGLRKLRFLRWLAGELSIGPMVSVGAAYTESGRAAMTIEGDMPLSGHEDILHECALPGKAGCVSGMTGTGLSGRIKFSLNLAPPRFLRRWVDPLSFSPEVESVETISGRKDAKYFIPRWNSGTGCTSPDRRSNAVISCTGSP